MLSLLSLISSLAAIDLSFLQQPPMATLAILGISAGISIVTSLANRLVIDVNEYRKWMVESQHLRKELMEAMRSGNKRRIAKAQKRQQDMAPTQQKMMSAQMKIMIFTMIPFIFIWQILHNFFGGATIAYMPFNFPFIAPKGTLSIATWYLFCSISTSIILNRILGRTFEIEPKES